jgi:hypothetical protein
MALNSRNKLIVIITQGVITIIAFNILNKIINNIT